MQHIYIFFLLRRICSCVKNFDPGIKDRVEKNHHNYDPAFIIFWYLHQLSLCRQQLLLEGSKPIEKDFKHAPKIALCKVTNVIMIMGIQYDAANMEKGIGLEITCYLEFTPCPWPFFFSYMYAIRCRQHTIVACTTRLLWRLFLSYESVYTECP